MGIWHSHFLPSLGTERNKQTMDLLQPVPLCVCVSGDGADKYDQARPVASQARQKPGTTCTARAGGNDQPSRCTVAQAAGHSLPGPGMVTALTNESTGKTMFLSPEGWPLLSPGA